MNIVFGLMLVSQCHLHTTSVTLDDKEDIVMCIIKHFLMYICKGELDQLKSGLNHLGVFNLIQRHPKHLCPLLTMSGRPKLKSSRF